MLRPDPALPGEPTVQVFFTRETPARVRVVYLHRLEAGLPAAVAQRLWMLQGFDGEIERR